MMSSRSFEPPEPSSGALDAQCSAVHAISTLLRQHQVVPDEQFDRVFPIGHRYRSALHWTPIEIALRACAWLAPEPDSTALDIGSGVGKVCLVGALTTPGQWVGIERDANMVSAAIKAARALGVANRTCFVHGELASINWAKFDGFYLFNPFAEALFAVACDPVERQAAYIEHVAQVQRGLVTARPGTRVVTYHGFGGEFPRELELVHREPAREDELCFWVRR